VSWQKPKLLCEQVKNTFRIRNYSKNKEFFGIFS
jgi:hypothetical protein